MPEFLKQLTVLSFWWDYFQIINDSTESLGPFGFEMTSLRSIFLTGGQNRDGHSKKWISTRNINNMSLPKRDFHSFYNTKSRFFSSALRSQQNSNPSAFLFWKSLFEVRIRQIWKLEDDFKYSWEITLVFKKNWKIFRGSFPDKNMKNLGRNVVVCVHVTQKYQSTITTFEWSNSNRNIHCNDIKWREMV